LVGVIDRSPAVARQFAETWKIPFFGTKLMPAVEKTGPDLVSICSPTNTHVPVIKELCQAGVRAILCEKPIAYDLPAAEGAVELCEKNGVLLAINYQRNWDRQFNRIRKSIRQAQFGRTELIRVLYSKGLIHNGSHFISLLDQWFGGLEITRILSIERYEQDDVIADFTATCPAVSRIIFQNVSEQSYVLNEIEALFERGRLELRRGGLDIYWTDRNSDPLLPKEMTLSNKAKKLPATLPRAMLEVIRNITDVLGGKGKLQSDARAALRTLRFCARLRTLA
ncbi:MAG: Gfo/Idh/MocA family oxidoreductase, partial [Verrucomicrobia bacterium]|nr:Gfo/Idh/MocA family oxidoreductase [Verrucomicrobiota bacterium]